MAKTKKTKKSSQDKVAELQAFVLELYQLYEGSLDSYLWPWEVARWYELVYCFIVQIGSSEIPTDDAYRIVSTLAELNLLEIDALAAFVKEGGKPDLSEPDLVLVLEVLTRLGLSSDKATAVLVTICEAAAGFQGQYQGKVQRFLRKYGSLMIKDLGDTLSFSKLSTEDTEVTLTHWLQNVINMPLILSESKLEVLCTGLEVTMTDLVDAVDDLDLNLTLVDDLLFSWIESEYDLADIEEED